MQEMLDFIVAERPDHCGGKTEGDRLQHEAFGRVTGLHVDIAMPTVAILDGRTLERRSDADHRWRACDPLLTSAASTNFSRV